MFLAAAHLLGRMEGVRPIASKVLSVRIGEGGVGKNSFPGDCGVVLTSSDALPPAGCP